MMRRDTAPGPFQGGRHPFLGSRIRLTYKSSMAAICMCCPLILSCGKTRLSVCPVINNHAGERRAAEWERSNAALA